jgi:hypothetical protein
MPFLLANWKLVFVGILLLALGVQTWRLDRAKAEVAEVQALVTACEGRVTALGKQIEAQNGAVRALESAGKARQARAAQGIKEAEKRARTAQNEAQRLREAIFTPPVSECPAAEAVQKIRSGLK